MSIEQWKSCREFMSEQESITYLESVVADRGCVDAQLLRLCCGSVCHESDVSFFMSHPDVGPEMLTDMMYTFFWMIKTCPCEAYKRKIRSTMSPSTVENIAGYVCFMSIMNRDNKSFDFAKSLADGEEFNLELVECRKMSNAESLLILYEHAQSSSSHDTQHHAMSLHNVIEKKLKIRMQ